MYLKSILIISIFLSVLFTACKKEEQVGKDKMTQNTEKQILKTPEDAGKKGLQDLMKLANDSNIKDLGFGSLDEIRSAQLGNSLKLRTLSYDRLLGYKEGMSSNELFAGGEQLLFPVTVKGSNKSSVVVEKAGDNWKVSSLGDRGLGKLAEDGRNDFHKRKLDSSGVKEADFFLVTAPG